MIRHSISFGDAEKLCEYVEDTIHLRVFEDEEDGTLGGVTRGADEIVEHVLGSLGVDVG